MFNNSSTVVSATKNNNNSTSVITKGSTIKGDLVSDENIRLDGCVIGQIHCKQRLVVGKDGKMEGTIHTDSADISGIIQGDIAVFGHLIIHSSARIFGNIQAQYIQVDEGAILEGECKVGKVEVNRIKKSPKVDIVKERVKSRTIEQMAKPKKKIEKPVSVKKEVTPPKPIVKTPIVEKVLVAPVVAAQEKEILTRNAQHFYPEGEFKHLTELKPAASVEAGITLENDKIAPQHLVRTVVPKKKPPVRKFNAAKFIESAKKSTEERNTHKKNEDKGNKRYGIKLPSINVKW